MGRRKLARAVVIEDRVYRPGDVPSAEDAKLITNPKAWDGDSDADTDAEVDEVGDDSDGDVKGAARRGRKPAAK